MIKDIFQPHSKQQKVDCLLKLFIKNSDGSYTIPFDITTEMFRLLKPKLKDIKIKEVQGTFNCGYNEITSLEGLPKEVQGTFNCGYNKLISLEGAPKYVGGSFHCSNNRLTSLKGAPEFVGGAFDCYNNDLTSLEGVPKYVGGDFFCLGNIKKFTVEDVQKVCNVRGEIYV